MNTNHSIIAKIHYLSKLLDQNLSKLLEEKGLTPQQGRVLLFVCNVYEKEEITQETLCRVFELSKSTVSGLVKRLVNNDLIKLEINKNSHILKPTDKGNELRLYFKEQRDKTIEKLLNNVSEKENDELMNKLDLLISNMRKEN